MPTIGIYAKKWTTHGGRVIGGNPIKKMALHRMLRSKIYLGYVECKVTGTIARGEHAPIITQELFDAVQAELENNANHKSGRTNGSPNLLSGRLYNADGTRFTNQSTVRARRPTLYYYAGAGEYLPARDVDKLATDTIVEFLNSDLSTLPDTLAHTLKQIDYGGLDYMARRCLVQTLIRRAIYAPGRITFFINTDADALRAFIRPDFINTQNNKIDFMRNGDDLILARPVVLNKWTGSNKYSAGRGGLMTRTDNHNMIVRAFATAWRYRMAYEKHGDLEYVVKSEQTSWRSLYRYLNLAYMHPDKVNDILSGKEACSMTEIFAIATKHQI